MSKKKRNLNPIVKCKTCGSLFALDKYHSRYCSDDCRRKFKSQYAQNKYQQKGRYDRIKLRFEIFSRDDFTCRYCGRNPPECILEIDHENPKSKGGINELENYITSCRECNRGKGDILLKQHGHF